ncbi:reverse transcriptase [Gossypium australe]|uniref:Reverse transcriptase n=1 Tax=Gossypium australe TaxID=47621 RepID=A0A5B6W8U7_9ROSI|nr:reverse transcriptase [Gossypium australe]
MWLMNGDKNTSYFHSCTLARLKKNRIKGLIIGNDWCFEDEELKNHVVDFFKDLYTLDYSVSGVFLYHGKFPFVPSNELDRLLIAVSNNEVLEGQLLDPILNRTLLVLLPKTKGPERISQFRSISLCIVLYKIITKMLVNRLRPLMVKLICQNQASFILGVAQEVVHSMKGSKGNNYGMMLKIDLEKTYDKIRWDFLKDSLLEARFPLLLEGSEYISHLFFANDLFLFREASRIQARVVNMNRSKSQVFFSPVMPRILNGVICVGVMVTYVEDLVDYLGMPLFYTRVTIGTFTFVVDKVRKKLSGWEAKKLSLVGHLTLVRAILLVIRNYFMNTICIPISVCREIEQIAQNFSWGL